VPGNAEARVRAAWNGEAGAALRLLSAVWAVVTGTRNLLYDAGVVAARRAPLPVVSIGGLTAGGAGKTPITADMAARLERAGVRTAILTHGFEDEMAVHRRLSPHSRVYGGRDRSSLASRARDEGAQIALLDSGFQHRRLHRDLDIIVLDPVTLGSRLLHLPAGPFREGLASLGRADLVILVGRPGSTSDDCEPADGGKGATEAAARRLRDVEGLPPVVSARVHPGGFVAVTEAARTIGEPSPGLAVAGVMWPEVFFRQVRERIPGLEDTLRLTDHAKVSAGMAAAMTHRAGDGGIVCTLKDADKLVRALGETVPVWYLSEEVIWEDGQNPPKPVRMAGALADRGGDRG
jgi:tetraacyldisaccharide 4'-kinase